MKKTFLFPLILLFLCGTAYSWPWGGNAGVTTGVGGGTVTEVTGNSMIGVATGTSVPALSLTDNSITGAKLLDNTITIGKIGSTGTANNTTYFRGDGVWTPDLSANSLQAYGTNGIAIGTAGTYGGKIVMKSGTGSNTFLFTINASNFASDLAWTLPTASPAGNDYLIRSSTAGVLSYVDPATFSPAVSDTAYAGTWDGILTIPPSKNAVYDEMETKAPKASPVFTGAITFPANQSIATLGLINGKIGFLDNTAAPTDVQMHGQWNLVNENITVLLPTAVGGMHGCIQDTGAAHDIIVDVQGTDTMTLVGATQAAGLGITNAAGSSTGDYICVLATGTNKWTATFSRGTWASQ
jgi:hypothetical protein